MANLPTKRICGSEVTIVDYKPTSFHTRMFNVFFVDDKRCANGLNLKSAKERIFLRGQSCFVQKYINLINEYEAGP